MIPYITKYMSLIFSNGPTKKDEIILCGPDNEVGRCLLQLMSSSVMNMTFEQELHLLHFKMSKIAILSSTYKDGGLNVFLCNVTVSVIYLILIVPCVGMVCSARF